MRRLGVFLFLSFLAGLLSGGITIEPPEGNAVGRQCRACHAEIVNAFPLEAHGRAAYHNYPIDCRSCHGEAYAHMESIDSVHIINPAKVREDLASGICLSCHMEDWSFNLWKGLVHTSDDLKHCPSCHRVHRVSSGRLPVNTADR